MTTVKDIAEIIQKRAPLSLAEPYDNPGLLIGGGLDKVKGVMLSVDVTRAVAEEAAAEGCNLIVSHHPIIFTPIKAIDTHSAQGGVIAYCLKNGINLYAAHTNADNMTGNMSVRLAEIIGGSGIKSLTERGLGALFKVDTIRFGDLVKKVAEAIDGDVRSVGDLNALVSAVAAVTGAGGRDEELIGRAAAAGAEVYISGEFRYSIALEAAERGLKIIEIGHYDSEKLFKDIMYDIIAQKFKGKIIKSKREANPFNKEIQI